MRRWLGIFVMIVLPYSLMGQDNRRCLAVKHADIITSDYWIEKSTIDVPSLSKTGWSIIEKPNNTYQIIFATKQPAAVEVCFRVLPIAHATQQIALEGEEEPKDSIDLPLQATGLITKRQQLFNLGDISKGGRISRGISMGNTQDLFVNSALNLNLEGKLSEDLNIRASITDQNIPYQPEGNTQQLQDFDNVFVELYNDRFSVAGGDIVFRNGDTHFLRYLKNVQGGTVATNLKGARSSLGLSSAKGKFGSIELKIEDGVSGPYPINPEANGAYVIIIANSEKVYLDGRLLLRGFNNDYVIDYNQAEISFTSNIMLTKVSRVRIDLEYAVQDYARGITRLSHQQQIGKVSLSAEYYQEKDNKNKSLFRTLSNEQKQLLSEVGDSLDLAISPGEKLVPYSPDRVLYIKRDTIGQNGAVDTVFVRAKSYHPETYDVQFTEVGSGKGSYNIGEYLPQGRVYEYQGIGLGDFVPYVLLGAPDLKKMLVLNGNVAISNELNVYFETALSDQDLNLFSDLDDGDNKGYALKAGINLKEKPLTGAYKLSANLDAEFLSKNFRAIDRFRRVEFDRDWSTEQINHNKDLLVTAGVGLAKDAQNKIDYKVQFRNKQGFVQGVQHWLEFKKSIGKIQLNTNGFLMNSQNGNNTSNWRRLNAEIYYKGVIQPGYRFSTNRNTVEYSLTDSIISSANYFNRNEFFIRNAPTNKTQFELAYVIREDAEPIRNQMKFTSQSHFASARFTTVIRENHNVSMRLNYRLFKEEEEPADPVNSISGRLNWTGDLIKGVFFNELNYSISNARVAKKEYVFVPVATGEGTHTWQDDNLDGVKDLDEFYEAINFDEKNYIKLYVHSSDYTDAFENMFNYRARLNFPKNWRQAGGMKAFLTKFSNTTSWTSLYRTTSEDISSRLLPFWFAPNASDVLSMKESIRSTFFFNRSNPRFGASGGVLYTQRKYLYTNGFEGRNDQEYNFTFRWNLTRTHNLKIASVTGQRLSNSDYLDNRNFTVRDFKIGPSFSWQPKPSLRITSTYQTGMKMGQQTEQLASESRINEAIGEIKFGSANKYMLQATVKYSKVQFEGNELSPLGYELLQGMRPGDNVQWNLGWQQHLINGLQIGVYYGGRKPQGVDIVHTARASVSALF
jgi:hypothetical protein